MTTKTSEYKEKGTTHFTGYYHYKGSASVMSLQRSIDAVQKEMFAITDKVEDVLPLFKWSIGHDNEQKTTILKLVVNFISVGRNPAASGSRGDTIAIGSPVVPPVNPPPPPHHPAGSELELVDPEKFNLIATGKFAQMKFI